MGADSYYSPIVTVAHTPQCTLCGWRGDQIVDPLGRAAEKSRYAFAAHVVAEHPELVD